MLLETYLTILYPEKDKTILMKYSTEYDSQQVGFPLSHLLHVYCYLFRFFIGEREMLI